MFYDGLILLLLTLISLEIMQEPEIWYTDISNFRKCIHFSKNIFLILSMSAFILPKTPAFTFTPSNCMRAVLDRF